MILHKDNLVRDIKPALVEKYIAAGWQPRTPRTPVVEPVVVQADEVINLKPPARVKAAAKKADDDAIEQGE